jgi:hypothetical protein
MIFDILSELKKIPLAPFRKGGFHGEKGLK